MRRIILFAAAFFVSFIACAQKNFDFVDDYIIEETPITIEIIKQLKEIKENFHFNSKTEIDSIPVRIHFVRNDDGSGQLANLADLQPDIDTVNKYFETINLVFYLCNEVNYIDNSALYDFEYSTEIGELMDNTKIPWAINIYYTGNVSLGSGKSMALGMGLGGTYEGVICDYDLVGFGIIMAHEFGHVFHLYHTHGKYNWEVSDCDYSSWTDTIIPGEVWCQGAVMYDEDYSTDLNNDGIPDSQQTGDNITDTHAEPCLAPDSLTNGCDYIGTLTDYYGEFFDVVIGNIMSYGPCLNHFSLDQYVKMRHTYETYGMKLNCGGCSGQVDKIVTNADNTGYGSLRWALDCANCTETDRTVTFNLDDTASNTIILDQRLQYVKEGVTIDGLTEPSGEIIINGANLTQNYHSCFLIDGDDVTIKGLSMMNFPNAAVNNYYGYAGLIIEDCNISNMGYYGIYDNNSAGTLIKNNTFTNNNYASVYIDGCTGSSLTGNAFNQNDYYGVYLGNCSNILFDEGNIFGQNYYYGLLIDDNSSNIEVYNSYFGTDPQSTPNLGNGYDGIAIIQSSLVDIGGEGMGNVIADNLYDGILVYEQCSDINIVNNIIGLSNNGEPLPNGNSGVAVSSSSNITIGGETADSENLIGYNGSSVMMLDGTTNCFIKRNSMFCSQYAVYIDGTSNIGMEEPVITGIPDEFTIEGTSIDGADIWVYTSNSECSSCEGEVFLGKTTATGTSWQIILPHRIYNGDLITAMASIGSTSSEFSECYEASGLPSRIYEASNNAFRIYPNPARLKIKIVLDKDYKNRPNIELYNTLGSMVLAANLDERSNEVSLLGLNPGVYYLRVVADKDIYTGKLFIK